MLVVVMAPTSLLILSTVPTISKAINYDLPSVIANSNKHFDQWILHMWEDEQCLKVTTEELLQSNTR
ncbi:hypothetical protein LINPERPRIM_LOCUS22198, partial [Linum perenne]